MIPDGEYGRLEHGIQVEAKVRSSFDPGTLELLIDSLHESYRTVAESNVAELGFNSQTFGFSLYHVSVNNLIRAAQLNPEKIRILSQYPRFRLAIGDYEVGAYRVGEYPDDDILTSFPRSDGATKRIELTPFLPGMDQPDLLSAKHIILAHMGNPDDLLCAAYLCIPTSLGDDFRISEWGFVHPIFSASELIKPAIDDSRPPQESPRNVVVLRKNQENQRTDHNA